MPMNVILLERVPKLGQMGDVVKVKPGFARNFLLPQKKALRATKENLAYFEKQRVQLEAQNLKLRADAQAVGDKMGENFAVVIIRTAGESGRSLFSASAAGAGAGVVATTGATAAAAATGAAAGLDAPVPASIDPMTAPTLTVAPSSTA